MKEQKIFRENPTHSAAQVAFQVLGLKVCATTPLTAFLFKSNNLTVLTQILHCFCRDIDRDDLEQEEGQLSVFQAKGVFYRRKLGSPEEQEQRHLPKHS